MEKLELILQGAYADGRGILYTNSQLCYIGSVLSHRLIFTNNNKMSEVLEVQQKGYKFYSEEGTQLETINVVLMFPEMVPIPGEKFLMGKYTVTFEEWMSYCIHAKLEEIPDDAGWGRGRRPIINVSAIDAAKYCNWLNAHIYLLPKDHPTYKAIQILHPDLDLSVPLGPNYIVTDSEITRTNLNKGFRLPTEQEWITAAADVEEQSKTIGLENIAWFADNSDNMTHPVGEKTPNKFGLYDMLGNVWEICEANQN